MPPSHWRFGTTVLLAPAHAHDTQNICKIHSSRRNHVIHASQIPQPSESVNERVSSEINSTSALWVRNRVNWWSFTSQKTRDSSFNRWVSLSKWPHWYSQPDLQWPKTKAQITNCNRSKMAGTLPTLSAGRMTTDIVSISNYGKNYDKLLSGQKCLVI